MKGSAPEIEPRTERQAGAMPSRWPFSGRAVLAPMEGISHSEFRDHMAQLGGIGLVCTEFVRVTASPVGRRQMARQVVKSPGVPLSVQVMGNDAERMAEAAELVESAGADVVDINLGCPMPRIVRKGVGAAMLKNPVLLEQVLCCMRQHTKGLLSAKIRAGFDDADQVLEIAALVQACGVDFIAVHPRRRADFYRGVADWRIIAAIKDKLDIPVVGNGDVWCANDALRMRAETNCDAVMIGRPALRNPWIFQQLAALESGSPPIHPSGRLLFEHLRALIRHYEKVFAGRKGGLVGPLKEMLTWHARALPDGRQRISPLLRLDSVDALLHQAELLLSPLSPAQLDLDAFGSLGLEQSGTAVPKAQATPAQLAQPTDSL